MTQSQTRYWPPHLPRQVSLPQVPLHHNLRVSAERFPDTTALWFYGREVSYRQLWEESGRLAGYLQRQGVRPGDRVLVWFQNSPQWAVAAHAVWRAGGVVVPLAPMLQPPELAYFLADAGVRVGLLGAELYAKARAAGLGHAVVANIATGVPADGSLPFPEGLDVPEAPEGNDVTWAQALAGEAGTEVAVAPGDRALIMYTSGTTGRPKGAVHTHASVQANVAGGCAWIRLAGDETVLASLPFFHVTGFANSLMAPIYGGSTVVVMARWDRETARTLIRERGVSLWTNTATMVIDLLANPQLTGSDLASVRDMTGGGASLPEAVGRRLFDLSGITFVEGYGLTETMAQSHTNPADRPKFQCLGIPVFGVDARIVDLDTGCELPPGETGEIVLRGPQVFQGYWNRPEATEEAFLTLDGERFFRTGDLGRVDGEGYFFFVDRLKRMVNVSGLKVWPAEVESVLHGHPAVQEACVIALPDERTGERARALIVLKPGQSATPEDIQAYAREQLAGYKVPREVVFVEGLPRSPTGKVAWRPLQEAARAELAQQKA